MSFRYIYIGLYKDKKNRWVELGVISERSDENLKTVRFLCPRQGQRHSRVADDAQVQYGYLLTNTHIGQTPNQ
ncbi:hypothetical protein Metig_0234 [Methanotorris igneus Kol 5]|uniref:Uncharacterized protein n=1 Tax=Methanotorris igneus (strain DSM 5666 / JCM 11834 / Kol 5) TaxID=880724 RepID=F6BAA1_METIK|nr:hypothetical protein Metig_0234 [Methanotorris igneus Kol 5]